MDSNVLWNAGTDILDREIVEEYVGKLQRGETGFYGVPEEIRNHPLIVGIERKLGIRKSDKRGYDVIRNTFFVEETVLDIRYIREKNCPPVMKECMVSNFFSEFAEYYEFLEGDIYEHACYFGYKFLQPEVDVYRIDMGRINMESLIDYTIKDSSVTVPAGELARYKAVEDEKTLRRKWIEKFNACNTYEGFIELVEEFRKCGFYKDFSKELFILISSFIYSDPEKAFSIIMKYVSERDYPTELRWSLLLIYDPQRVIAAYDYKSGTKGTIYKYKRNLRKLAEQIESGMLQRSRHSYFDPSTHYWVSVEDVREKGNHSLPKAQAIRFFENFQELTEYLEGDLSNCDLSRALMPNVDFTIYKTNANTKLPVQDADSLKYLLHKGYDRIKDCFVVTQCWLDANGQIARKCEKEFRYFFDFLHFLENDLSGADLLFCDGIVNLSDLGGIKFVGAKMKSDMADKVGIQYRLYVLDTSAVYSFPSVMQNEEETMQVIQREENIEENTRDEKIYYISDLHLLHRLQKATWSSEDDVTYILQKLIDGLLDKMCDGGILLIGGDTSSDFAVFMLFVKLLGQSSMKKKQWIKVIFLLGNHELWDFPGVSLGEITDRYNAIIKEQGMYLLQNNIIYLEDARDIQEITSEELISMPGDWIRKKLRRARIILFGGLAFSGCNELFNADNGIYRKTVNREEEIIASREFEGLYDIVYNAVPDRNVIVFTHTPWEDWCSHGNRHSGYVYVSGHTHKNFFYDDGVYRIYADNQVGYRNSSPGVKYFYMDREYDFFLDYDDGIYEITTEQYIDFYRGCNLPLTYNRNNILYMLKKNGFYCFLARLRGGKLAIMNGGNMKGLGRSDITYFYDRMDAVIAHIKKPLDKFTCLQEKISSEIQEIGGTGNIHGAIVDIDYWNHIYVNPLDLTITGYWASDIVYKKVYPDILQLLEEKCPQLYISYLKCLKGKAGTVLSDRHKIKRGCSARSEIYLNTDIYQVSREIKKMQKLKNRILSTWIEPNREMLE